MMRCVNTNTSYSAYISSIFSEYEYVIICLGIHVETRIFDFGGFRFFSFSPIHVTISHCVGCFHATVSTFQNHPSIDGYISIGET